MQGEFTDESTYALLAATVWSSQRRATLSKCVLLYSNVCAQWALRVLMQTGCYVFLLWLDNEERRKIMACMCLRICISGVVVFVFSFGSANLFFAFYFYFASIASNRIREQKKYKTLEHLHHTLFGCTVYPSLYSQRMSFQRVCTVFRAIWMCLFISDEVGSVVWVSVAKREHWRCRRQRILSCIGYEFIVVIVMFNGQKLLKAIAVLILYAIRWLPLHHTSIIIFIFITVDWMDVCTARSLCYRFLLHIFIPFVSFRGSSSGIYFFLFLRAFVSFYRKRVSTKAIFTTSFN